jgi:hypothetical protein
MSAVQVPLCYLSSGRHTAHVLLAWLWEGGGGSRLGRGRGVEQAVMSAVQVLLCYLS